MSPTFALMTFLIASPPTQLESKRSNTKLGFRVSVGEEWDTNVNRSLSISRNEAQGDLLTRLVSAASLHHQFRKNHYLLGTYVLGAKRFREAQDDDVIVQSLSLGSGHYLTENFRIETNARYRQSRMRSVLRDYSLGRGGLRLGWRSKKRIDYWIGGGANRFEFPSESRLNYSGVYGSAGVSGKVDKHLHWRVLTSLEKQFFDGNALTTVLAPWNGERVVTFCDDLDQRFGQTCFSPRREDSLVLGSAKVSYQHLFILGAEIQFQSRRSNSIYEDINRIRLSVFSTFELGYEIMVNALAAVQYTSEQSLSQNIFQYRPEDDENQNRITLQLSRVIHASLSGLLRYELFTNAFATNDTAFFRQTVFAGLSFEIDR
jgi:hypothetical protein